MKPVFMAEPGQPVMKWNIWLRLFNDYLLACSGDDIPEHRKLAILRSSLGAEGYRIFTELCPDDNLSYSETVQRLQDRFQPRPSRVFCRTEFHRTVQHSTEASAQFVTALRSLAAQCDYPDSVTAELVCDRFVAGCRDDKIRQRLLEVPDELTIERALDIARTMERAAVETRAVTSNSQFDISNIHRQRPHYNNRGDSSHYHNPHNSSSRSRVYCFGCGRDGLIMGHSGCRAVNSKCSKCGRTGHYTHLCRSDRQTRARSPSHSNQQRSNFNRSSSRNQSSSRNRSGSRPHKLVAIIEPSIYSMEGPELAELQYRQCDVAGQTIDLLLDSGARVSILNKEFVNKLSPAPTIRKSEISLSSYNGSKLPVLGTVNLSVKCSTVEIPSTSSDQANR